MQIALKHLQCFDPTGVGARNAQECLALQLEALPSDPIRTLALKIVRQHLELLAGRDFGKIKRHVECDDDQLRDAQFLIRSLNPRPGAKYAALDARYITPDVVVRKIRGQWTVNINSDAFPRLRINSLYAQILSRQRGSGLAGQLQEARWLIKNVQQRFDTILRVAQAIVDRQRQFFDHGEVAMRPLVLREIADILGLHESTVSRVTTQKYMATPRGIFELKYFFGSKLYIWKKEERVPVAKAKAPTPNDDLSGLYIPKLSDSKLKELTWSLDIKQAENPVTGERGKTNV